MAGGVAARSDVATEVETTQATAVAKAVEATIVVEEPASRGGRGQKGLMPRCEFVSPGKNTMRRQRESSVLGALKIRTVAFLFRIRLLYLHCMPAVACIGAMDIGSRPPNSRGFQMAS